MHVSPLRARPPAAPVVPEPEDAIPTLPRRADSLLKKCCGAGGCAGVRCAVVKRFSGVVCHPTPSSLRCHESRPCWTHQSKVSHVRYDGAVLTRCRAASCHTSWNTAGTTSSKKEVLYRTPAQPSIRKRTRRGRCSTAAVGADILRHCTKHIRLHLSRRH